MRVLSPEKALAQLEVTHNDADLLAFLDHVILDALERGASDIHFEPYEQHIRIRLRLDGLLETLVHCKTQFTQQMTTRLKILANLDIAEHRLPQDGRFHFQQGALAIDFRVSTCPTLYGEKIVLRFLKTANSYLPLDSLGLDAHASTHLHNALARPQGMIIVTGPTGSGKTMTLYAALKALNQDTRNISTVEDPIEITVEGINQVSIHNKIGLTFSQVLRAFLRQDPDIIMLGEIRDADTADIAIKAAQTGHLVLTTLHTNSALETLNRLHNLGVSQYNLASAVSLVLAQRLVRRLCPLCKTFDLSGAYQANPHGCSACHKGYHGRFALFEALPITPTLQQAIFEGASMASLHALAQETGFTPLILQGQKAVKEGITSYAEISRVIQT